MRGRGNILAAVMLAAITAGCGQRPGGLYQRLQSHQESELAQAAVDAGAANDRQAVPYLIEALEHEAADVRLFAITSLRRITGQDLGYRPWASPEERQAAIQRWRQWWGVGPATALSAGE
jgi:hypothetical protein